MGYLMLPENISLMASIELQRKINAVAKGLQSRDRKEVGRAIGELRRIGDLAVIPLIARVIKPPLFGKPRLDYLTIKDAIHALESLDHPDAIPHLAAALTHPDPVIRMYAGHAIVDLWEQARYQNKNVDHPAILAINAFHPLARTTRSGYIHVNHFLPLQKLIQLAVKKPSEFKDRKRASEHAVRLIEKYGPEPERVFVEPRD